MLDYGYVYDKCDEFDRLPYSDGDPIQYNEIVNLIKNYISQKMAIPFEKASNFYDRYAGMVDIDNKPLASLFLELEDFLDMAKMLK